MVITIINYKYGCALWFRILGKKYKLRIFLKYRAHIRTQEV
jgi:hypothetical protein